MTQRKVVKPRPGRKPLYGPDLLAEWDDAVPGFVEIDLVSHDGSNASVSSVLFHPDRHRYFYRQDWGGKVSNYKVDAERVTRIKRREPSWQDVCDDY